MAGLLIAKNKKALFDHQLLDKYVAGMVLHGNEVKALREKKVNFEGAYVQMIQNEAYVVNMNIGTYSKNSAQTVLNASTDPRRSRKLLLNRNEILDISRELKQKGKTAVPLAIVLINNRLKLEFAIVKGKKEFEKKVVVKERQIKRDMDIAMKDFRRAVDA